MTSPTFEPGGNLPAPLSAQAIGNAFTPGAGASAARMSPVTRFVAALKRFKWLVLALFLTGIAAGVLATRMLPPKYTVRSSLTLENRGDNSAGPIEGQEIFTAGQWVELLGSSKVRNPVVEESASTSSDPIRVHLDEGALEGPSGPARICSHVQGTDRTSPGNYTIESGRGSATPVEAESADTTHARPARS